MTRSRFPLATAERHNVALLVQTANDWSRQVLRGVANYAHERGNWDFFIEPRGFYEHLQLPRDWQGDGVIIRLTHDALARSIRRRRVPAVNVSWLGKHSQAIPKVVSDEPACGRLAAEHFLERGFRSFGYVGPVVELGYANVLGKVFAKTVQENGYQCSEFTPAAAQTEPQTRRRRERLLRWLSRLRLPVGVLVWNTSTGREITAICSTLGLQVPDDVAVVCSEHDPLISSLAPIPLSNLDQRPDVSATKRPRCWIG